MSTPDQHADFVAAFMDDYFAECEEHLSVVRRDLLALEAAIGEAVPPPAIVEELFRSFHSLKGISAMVELREAEQLAHEMESCLRAIRQRDVVLSTPVLDALVDGVHGLDRVIAARREKTAIPSISAALGRLTDVSRAPVAAAGAAAPASAPANVAPDAQLWNVTFTPSPALVARGVKVDTIRARLMAVGQIHSVAPRVAAGGIAFDFLVATDNGEAFAAWRADGIEAALAPAPVLPGTVMATADDISTDVAADGATDITGRRRDGGPARTGHRARIVEFCPRRPRAPR